MIRWLRRRLPWSVRSSETQPDPPTPSEWRFTVEEIDELLLGLPDLERAVFLNHRISGMSYKRMARRLRMSVDEVERIMARAIFQLMQAGDELERRRR